MANRGITLVASHNYCTRRIRCGISDRTIEKEEPTIYVATRRGRDCKPEMLLGAVVRTIRRAEEQYDGWEPIDIAAILGLEVRLAAVALDRVVVMLGKWDIYLAWSDIQGLGIFAEARELADSVAEALGTTVVEIDFSGFRDKDAFITEHGIPVQEWVERYRDAAVALGIFDE